MQTYVARDFGKWEQWGYEYQIWLEVSPKFVGSGRLGVAIIYIKKYLKNKKQN
jgi:hypothetical protein